MTGPWSPGRTGGKHYLITNASGIPLAITQTGGNRNDVTRPGPQAFAKWSGPTPLGGLTFRARRPGARAAVGGVDRACDGDGWVIRVGGG
ncbi:hypothetical protein SUDANB43_07321 [Streptomyces sp. enrichment culture]